MLTSPCADMIEDHKMWMMAAGRFSENTIHDARELLYRVDYDLAETQLAAGDKAGGLATAWPEELVAWLARGMAWGKKRWSRQTLATYRQHLVRFYGWACSGPDPRLTYDPSGQLARPKVNPPDVVSATDAQVAYIHQHAIDPFWLYFGLAARLGFRPSDIANAERKHFVVEPRIIDGQLVEVATVRVRGKGDKPAILPCDPEIWEAVQDLPDGPIARRPDGRAAGGQVTAQTITNDSCYYLHEKLHLDITLRNLRVWYATTMLERYAETKSPGEAIRVVQELMRHSSLQTLQRYTAVVEAKKRAAVLTLPRFGPRSVAAAAAAVAPAATTSAMAAG